MSTQHDSSAIAAQNEDTATLMFDVAQASMVLNGMDPRFQMLIVFSNPDTGGTAIVGSLEWAKARDIVQQYIEKNAAATQAASTAIQNMRGTNNG